MHYKSHVATFSQFIYRTEERIELDDYVKAIKAGEHDPYDILAEFAAFAKKERTGPVKITANTLSKMVRITKRFLKFSGCAITNEDFREQISLPRSEAVEKKAADKQDVITILSAVESVRLKTYLMFEAVYGSRPKENCALRNTDVLFDSDEPSVTFRPEFSKMRVARTKPIARELVNQTRL